MTQYRIKTDRETNNHTFRWLKNTWATSIQLVSALSTLHPLISNCGFSLCVLDITGVHWLTFYPVCAKGSATRSKPLAKEAERKLKIVYANASVYYIRKAYKTCIMPSTCRKLNHLTTISLKEKKDNPNWSGRK